MNHPKAFQLKHCIQTDRQTNKHSNSLVHRTRWKKKPQSDNKSNTHFHQKIERKKTNTNHCCVKFKWFSTFYAQYTAYLGFISLDSVICPDLTVHIAWQIESLWCVSVSMLVCCCCCCCCCLHHSIEKWKTNK